MGKYKKSVAGHVVVCLLFVGVNSLESNVSNAANAAIAVFYLHAMILDSVWKIVSSGLKKWILERQPFKTFSRDSGLSIDTLQHAFYTFLKQSPAVKILKRSNVHLGVDATYFKTVVHAVLIRIITMVIPNLFVLLTESILRRLKKTLITLSKWECKLKVLLPMGTKAF